jgi:hypothetical protein
MGSQIWQVASNILFYFTRNFLNSNLKNVTQTLQILDKTAVSDTSITESRLNSKCIKNVSLHANLHKVGDKSTNESCPCTPHKGICGTDGQAPCNLNLVWIWRQGKQLYHRHTLNRKLFGPHNQSEHFEEENSLLYLLGIQLIPVIQHTAQSLFGMFTKV